MMTQHLRDICSKSDRVLDLGSKDGKDVDRLEAETVAIDIDFQSSLANTNYILGDGRRMPFSSHTFDYVLCNQVFEHIPDISEFVAEMARVLKPGGKALITFPNRVAPIKPHMTPWWSSYLPRPIGKRLLPYLSDSNIVDYYINHEFMLTPLKARYFLHKYFKKIDYVSFRLLDEYSDQRLKRLDDPRDPGLIRKVTYGSAPYIAKLENFPILGWGIELSYPGVSYIATK
ncbi:class I SAM-dependent methyltransferase [Halolamina rubra]|uniref:class I SAM-dependent methyltransferase n=1 Tax=Halolamina rubra TaxID=1380430 RepID=UPI0013778069|nr:methyltransferase domain-containing protein [Halolamina rubra]